MMDTEVVITSNIGVIEAPNYTLDVSRYWGSHPFCSGNAPVLMLNLLIKAKVWKIVLTGLVSPAKPTKTTVTYI